MDFKFVMKNKIFFTSFISLLFISCTSLNITPSGTKPDASGMSPVITKFDFSNPKILEADFSKYGKATEEHFQNPLADRHFYITSLFGPRKDPITFKASYHNGADMAAPTGTPVYASMSGTVEIATWHKSYGNYVVIRHSNGYKTLYAHLSAITTSVGEKVTQKDMIGKVGSTGYSTGPHLHFTAYKNKSYIDPLTLVFKDEVLDQMLFPDRDIAQLHFIPETLFKVKDSPVTSVSLDLYYTVKGKSVIKEPTLNYVVNYGPGVTDVESLAVSLESSGERFDLKNTSILYDFTEDDGTRVVSYVAAITVDQMSKFLDINSDGELFIILNYGGQEDKRVSSKLFYEKIAKARGKVNNPDRPKDYASEWIPTGIEPDETLTGTDDIPEDQLTDSSIITSEISEK